MRRFPFALPAALLLALPLAPSNAQAPRAMQPNDWHRVTTLSDAAMSPDGKLVAFTVTTVVESKNERHREVWVVPTTGGDPVRYTTPNTESSNPRFSADGKYLFFNSQREGGSGSTWALRMDAPSGEATQLKDYPNGSWPRDARFAVFSANADTTRAPRDSTSPYRKMAAISRPPFDAITKPVDPARFDGRHITHERYKANGAGFLPGPTEERRIRTQQIFSQVPGDKRVQLTRTEYSHRSPTVSPDGRWIAFVADAQLRSDSLVQAINDSIDALPYDRAREDAPRNDADIYVIPVAGGTPRKVVELMGNEGGIVWSPDARRIAFESNPSRTANTQLMVIDVAGGTPTSLTAGWQYEPGSVEWLRDGDIAMSAEIGGSAALYRVDPRNGDREVVLDGRRKMRDFAFDAQGRLVAYVSTAVDAPTEVYVAGTDGKGERKLTGFNDKLNAEVAWSPAERFTFKSVGDVEIEGWLMKPFGYTEGKRYPLVLYIHGGPHSQYGEQWFDETQNLAAAGFMVLYTNPRGSSGYGADFTYSTRGRWFAEDYEDLMKAVDVVSVRPDVDSTRMGVTGGSYGGVMTAWVTVKTNRFKAAETDRMISNWWSWYGTSDARGLTEFEFYGEPWDNVAMYDSLSPIRYARQVQTPTLLVQSEEDHRTPMTDAEQWFIALKNNDVPAEFIRYPRSTHDLSRTGEPWLLVDRLGRLRDWFQYWLSEERVTAGQ